MRTANRFPIRIAVIVCIATGIFHATGCQFAPKKMPSVWPWKKEDEPKPLPDRILAVWSDEPPVVLDQDVADAFHCVCPSGDNGMHSCDDRNVVQGTVSFMPSLFGLMASGAVVNGIINRPIRGVDVGRRMFGEHELDTTLAEAPGAEAAEPALAK
jgi:hypothetical protein